MSSDTERDDLVRELAELADEVLGFWESGELVHYRTAEKLTYARDAARRAVGRTGEDQLDRE